MVAKSQRNVLQLHDHVEYGFVVFDVVGVALTLDIPSFTSDFEAVWNIHFGRIGSS